MWWRCRKLGPLIFNGCMLLASQPAPKSSAAPSIIQATYPGTGDNSANGVVVFDPAQYKERAALLLLNGVLYTTWASHCDISPYTGWIMGYDSTTLAQTTVLNLVPNGSEGAIWMADTGPAVDSAGNIYVLMANGDFGTTMDANGFPAMETLAMRSSRFPLPAEWRWRTISR